MLQDYSGLLFVINQMGKAMELYERELTRVNAELAEARAQLAEHN